MFFGFKLAVKLLETDISPIILHIIDITPKAKEDKCQLITENREVNLVVRTEFDLPKLGFKISKYNETNSTFSKITPSCQDFRDGSIECAKLSTNK